MQSKSLIRALSVSAAAAALCASAGAQSLLVTNGEVLAASGGPVAGIPHALYPVSTTSWVNPVVDESGRVLFACSNMTDDGTGLSGLANANNKAFLYGSTAATLSVAIRAGDVAPGLSPLTLSTSSNFAGPGSGYHISANGRMLWGSQLSTATTTIDTVLYEGTPGNWQIVAREGDTAAGAPGAAGCTYGSSSFNTFSQTVCALNNSGSLLFKMKLLGGDVSGTSNDDIWYVGQAGSLKVMLREGDAVGNNFVPSLFSTTPQMNSAGQVLHDETFSTTAGAPPALATDNAVLLLYTPGFGNSVYLREGAAAPGTIGATFNNAANTWSTTSSTNANNFNSSAQSLISLQLMNGDAVPGVNDMAIYVCSPTGQTMVLRRGDPAPGVVGATMDTVQLQGIPVSMGASPCIADNGVIAFRGRIAGGAVTLADDTGLWAGQPNALQLIYREGDVAPGTGGMLYGDAATTGTPFMNANGYVLIQNRLNNATDGLFLYDANVGGPPQLVALGGDSIEVLPGVFKTVSSFGNASSGNGSSAPMMFGNDDAIALRVTFTDNSNAIVLIGGYAHPTSYCTAGTTTNGCAPAISGLGTPSASAGSGFTISVGTVEGQKQGIIFYGVTGRAAAPWGSGGTSFLCVKAPTQRTGTLSSGGTLGACDGSLSLDWNAWRSANPGALGSPFTAGTIMDAQGWFRDPPAVKTTSLSDALEFTLQP